MTTHFGGMPPVFHSPTIAGSQVTSHETGRARLFGTTEAAVSAAPVRQAEVAARKTFMDFLERRGESGEYGRLLSLTGR